MASGAVLLRVLGPIEARLGERRIDLGGPQQRAVLARLLIARGEVVSVDRIIDDLWHGEPPPRAIGALQAYVSNLRKALEPQRLPRTPATVLVSAAPGYAVPVAAVATDARIFEAGLSDAAASGDDVRAAELLAGALASWRGPAFGEFAAEPWAEAEAARLDQLRTAAREELVERLARCGRAAAAVAEAETLVRDAPLRDSAWRLLALSQYHAGRQADALGTLRQARATLADELGVDPGPALRTLEQAILTHTVHDEPRTVRAPAPVEVTDPAPRGMPLVGREEEYSRLVDAAAAAQPRRPAVAVVSGEAGIGKSTLVGRLRDRLAEDDWLVCSCRCPEDQDGPPAWAVTELLRELAALRDPGAVAARLAPVLSDVRAPAAEDATQGRFRVQRAVGDWLDTITDRPVAFVVEDAHHADIETARMLFAVLDRRPRARLFVVVTHRRQPAPALDELLGSVATMQPARIALDGLSTADVDRLLGAVMGTPPSPHALRTVAERTNGNPFFVAELGRLLATEGEQKALAAVPQAVTDVVRRRVGRLPESTVRILQLVSLFGRSVDVDVLIAASDQTEEDVLIGLEAGVIAGLLVDDAPGAVRFAHALVRDAISSAVSPVRRRTWHAAIEAALYRLTPSDLPAIAYHAAEAATRSSAARAAELCRDAAGWAEQRYNYAEAARFYERASTCLQLADAPLADIVETGLCRITASFQAGELDTVRPAHAKLIELARRTADADLVARTLAAATPGTWGIAREYRAVDRGLVADLDRAIETHHEHDALGCLLRITRVRQSSFSDDPRTRTAAEQALAIARALDDPELTGAALIAMTEAVSPQRDADRYAALCAELRGLADRSGMHEQRLVAETKLLGLAIVHNEPGRAEDHHREAVHLARKLQAPYPSVYLELYRGALAHARGDLDAADAAYRSATTSTNVGFLRGLELVAATAPMSVAMSRGTGLAALADGLAAVATIRAPEDRFMAGLLALALLDRGDLRQAREALDQMTRVQLYEEPLRSALLAGWGLAAARLGEPGRCAGVYDLLVPYEGQLGGASSIVVTVPVDYVLGRLALVLGRTEAAAAHFATARSVARCWGNQIWLDGIAAAAATS